MSTPPARPVPPTPGIETAAFPGRRRGGSGHAARRDSRMLALSAATMASAVVLPALGPASAALSLYGTRRLHARAWRALVHDHRASVALLSSLFIVGALARGFPREWGSGR